jgi:hypothetical protein
VKEIRQQDPTQAPKRLESEAPPEGAAGAAPTAADLEDRFRRFPAAELQFRLLIGTVEALVAT